MYLNVPRAKVVERNWQSWPQFLATVGSMDLLLQPSYTEGFNMASADGIAQLAGCCRRRLRHCQQGSRVAPRSYGSAEGVTTLEVHHAIALIRWERFLQLFP
jgi:hypothetical protein